MSGKYQSYAKYKESGVEWLGEVPEHWEVMQLKRSVEGCVNGFWGGEPNEDENNTIVIRVADFERSKLSLKDDGYTYRKIEDKEKVRRQLKFGDLLLEKSGGGEKTLVGQVVLFDKEFEAITSNFVAKMTPNFGFDSRFLNYVFSRLYGERINYCSIKQNTGIQNLDSESYLAEKVGFPNLIEQQKIANFLDHETAKIDTLIEKQRRLIELLKEKRQAVISHAVTKGLNPNAPMKDSGVEWLGEVPEHWVVGCLKRFADIIDCKHFTVKFIDNGLPIVSIREVSDDKIDLSNANLTSKSEWDFLREGRVPEFGDLIFCRNASVGAVGYVDFDADFCMGQDVCLIRPEIASRYIHYQLTSVLIRNQIEAFLIGATIRRANVEEIRNLFVIYPPEDEQHLITDFLNRKTAKMDALILKAKNAIELMQERRTALISAAVTGKIDVRNWR